MKIRNRIRRSSKATKAAPVSGAKLLRPGNTTLVLEHQGVIGARLLPEATTAAEHGPAGQWILISADGVYEQVQEDGITWVRKKWNCETGTWSYWMGKK